MHNNFATIAAATDTPPDAAPAAPAAGFDITQWLHHLIEQPGEAFASVLTFVLIATGIVIVLHFVLAIGTKKFGPGPRRPWSIWEKLVYLATLATVSLLAATAFYSVLALGSMHRWPLFLHLMGAGAFVVVLMILTLTWAPACRFTCENAASADEQATTADCDKAPPPKFSNITKFTFWLLLVAGFATATTMLLSMLPIMGTHNMEQMITVHRYAGLLLVVATLLHLYSVCLGRLGWR